jgi:hypothetical protein
LYKLFNKSYGNPTFANDGLSPKQHHETDYSPGRYVLSVIDERLDRITSLVENNAQHIAALHTITQFHSEQITSLRVAQQQYQQNFEVVQNEIKGLQLENRRILDHLFGASQGEHL